MTSLDLPRRLSFLCAEFSFGDPALPTFLRVTSAAGDQQAKGYTFVSEPALAVQLDMQSGAIEDKPFRISLPTNRPDQPAVFWFANALASLEPFPPVRVLVFEVSRPFDGTSYDICHLAEGEILNSRTNPDGKDNIVEIEFSPTKSNLKNIKLGLPANASCGLTYGGAGCLKDNTVFYDSSSYYPLHTQVISGYGTKPKVRRAWVELTTDTGLRRQRVNLVLSRTQHAGASNLTLTSQPRGWWLGSYLTKDGLAIPIRDWWWSPSTSSGTNIFILGKIPPASWLYNPSLDNKLLLVPGCSKTKAACTDRANLAAFAGYGYGIPAYNPLIDDASR